MLQKTIFWSFIVVSEKFLSWLYRWSLLHAYNCKILWLYIRCSMGISKMNVQAPGCLTSTSSGPIPTSVMCLIVVYSFTLLNIMEFQNGEVSSFLFAYFLDDLCLFYSSVLNFCKKKLCDLFFFNWVFITLTSFRWNIFLIGFTCWEKTAGKLASISSAVQQSVRSHHFLPSCVVLLSRRDWVHKLLYFLLCCFYIQNILSFYVNL